MSRYTSIFEPRATITRWIALAALPAILLLGSCSKGQSAVCTDAQNLKDSLTTLTQISPSSTTAATLQTDVNNVKTAADALKSQAQSTFGTEITAIETQLTTLGGVVTAAANGGASITSQLATVVPALSALKTGLSDLQTTAQSQNCNLK